MPNKPGSSLGCQLMSAPLASVAADRGTPRFYYFEWIALNGRVARPVTWLFSDRPGLHRRQTRLGPVARPSVSSVRSASSKLTSGLRPSVCIVTQAGVSHVTHFDINRYRSRRRIRCGNSLGPTRAENRHHRTQITGVAFASTSAASPRKHCFATQNWRISSTQEAATFGISSSASFDFGAAFDRSRKVAEGASPACTT